MDWTCFWKGFLALLANIGVGGLSLAVFLYLILLLSNALDRGAFFEWTPPRWLSILGSLLFKLFLGAVTGIVLLLMVAFSMQLGERICGGGWRGALWFITG